MTGGRRSEVGGLSKKVLDDAEVKRLLERAGEVERGLLAWRGQAARLELLAREADDLQREIEGLEADAITNGRFRDAHRITELREQMISKRAAIAGAKRTDAEGASRELEKLADALRLRLAVPVERFVRAELKQRTEEAEKALAAAYGLLDQVEASIAALSAEVGVGLDVPDIDVRRRALDAASRAWGVKVGGRPYGARSYRWEGLADLVGRELQDERDRAEKMERLRREEMQLSGLVRASKITTGQRDKIMRGERERMGIG